ncbi:PAS domain S-box protein [Pontiellaceae bacterium B1224]|nr:PAS domain S-box protein [Pontiellaceae bacterium B1224]
MVDNKLRTKVEELLRKNPQETPVLSTVEVQKLLQELEVYQTELATKRDAYEELYDFAPVGYLTLDPKGRITEANSAAAAALGMERGKLMVELFVSFVHPDSLKTWERHRLYLAEHPEKHGTDLLLQRPDGSVLTAYVECSPHLNDEQQIDRFLIALVDISKRVKTEISLKKSERNLATLSVELEELVEERSAELRDSEERFRLLFDEAPDACFLHSLNGRILDGNKAAGELVGCSREKLVGLSLIESGLISEASIAIIRDHLSCLEQGERVGSTELGMIHNDGTEIPVEATAVPIRIQGQTLALCSARNLTQRKQAEKTLRESEERFRTIFDQVPDGILLADSESGKFHMASQAFCTLMGYSEEQVLEMGSEGIHPAEDLPYVIDAFEKQARGEVDEVLDIPFLRSDGAIFYADMKAFPILLDGKRYLLGHVRDITERREAEKQVRFEQNLFLSFMEILPACVYFKDRDSRFIRANQPTAAIFGVEKENLIGKTDADFYPEEEAEERRLDEQQIMQTRQPIQLEEQHGDQWFQTTKAPRYDASGGVVGTLGISFDITEKKHAQQEVIKSQRLLRGVIDTMHDRVWWKDLNSVYLGCNLNFAHDAGLEHPDQLIGKTDHDLCRKELADHFVSDDREVIASGRPKLGIQEVMMRTEGETRWAETNKIPLHDNEGKIIGTVGTYTDVTERKLAEAEREFLGRQRQLALDAAELGWWHFNPKTGISSFDECLATIYGIPRRECPVEDFFATIHPDDRAGVETALNAALNPRDPQPYATEYRLNHPDGSLRWIEAHGLAVFDGEGEERHATAFSGTVADITERRGMQDALEKRVLALTQPFDQPEAISFDDLFDRKEIQRIQDEFSNATGVASIISLPDGTPITEPSNFTELCWDIIRQTEKGRANCLKSDAAIGQHHSEGPIVQQCLSCGLWAAGASIEVGGRHIANWVIGQVRDESQNEEQMRAYAREIGADEDAVAEAFHRVPVMTSEHFKEISQALFMVANQLSTSAYQNVQQARFIAEQKQAERDLHESEERFRALFEEAPDACFLISEEGRFIEGNRAVEFQTGYSREELDGQSVFESGIFPSAARKTITLRMKRMKRMAGGEQLEPIEYELVRKDGSLLSVEVSTMPIRFKGKMVFLSTARDLTQRRLVEQALKESEEKYRMLFESETDAIMIFDGETRRFVDVNVATEQLYGYTHEQFLNITHGEISADSEMANVNIPQTLAGKRLSSFISQHRKKDGTVFPVEITACSFLLKGRPVICAVIRDITERMMHEEELVRSRGDLRKLASELSVAEQRERERIARELHDSVSQLLSSSALRLGTLRENSALSKATVDAVDQIADITHQALQEIRSLTFELSCPMLNELGLAAALEELCAGMSHGNTICFEFMGETELLPLHMSRKVVLYRTVRELLINVMKHSGAERACVRLDREGNSARICVEDDGKGFDASTAGKGFSPSGGFGLFSMSEHLRNAGGELQVESVSGGGTKVVLTVPLEEKHE